MGVFEHFPYVNYHELNLSWILRKLEELEDVIGTQIVDIVARAGVAENAQAIADLTETVETVETTANNAVSAAGAAQSSANAAQTTANSAASTASSAQNTANSAASTASAAQTTANQINTNLTPVYSQTITLAPGVALQEGYWTRWGHFIDTNLFFKAGDADIIGGTSLLCSGLPNPFHNTGYLGSADVYSAAGSFVKSIRYRIDTEGNLKLWYGGNLPANNYLLVNCIYTAETY